MKKPFLLLAATALFVGAVVYAEMPSLEAMVKNFRAGFYVGPASVTTASANKISASYGIVTSYDFGVLSNNAINAPCEETPAMARTGVLPGDPCMAGSTFGADGGAALPDTIGLSCKVTAPGSVKLRACTSLTDAGTVDLGDGGYVLRIFH